MPYFFNFALKDSRCHRHPRAQPTVQPVTAATLNCLLHCAEALHPPTFTHTPPRSSPPLPLQPTVQPVTAATLNYAGPIAAGVLLFALLWWALDARKWFDGPLTPQLRAAARGGSSGGSGGAAAKAV